MKKVFILILGFMLFTGCNIANDTVAITTNVNKYTPAMSSIQGIIMTPQFKSAKKYNELKYHWSASDGEFIKLGKEVENQGEAVTWSAISQKNIKEIKNSIEIKLEVIDSSDSKVLAKTKLIISPNKGFYEVQK